MVTTSEATEKPLEVSEKSETIVQLNLRQKMLQVMTDIEHIEKRGEHPKFHYAFAQAEDVFLDVRKAFLKHRIVFVSSEGEPAKMLDSAESTAGNEVFRCVVWMKFTFYDADSDEKIEGFSSGEAMDNQDKGVNKAKTAALKTFLLQTFLIPTGDDIEAEDHEAKGKGASKARKGTGPTACPSCGVVGAIIKGKEEYGGGWLCFGKKGGCGAKFQTDPSIPPAVTRSDDAALYTGQNPAEKASDAQKKVLTASILTKFGGDKEGAEGWLKKAMAAMNPPAKFTQLSVSDVGALIKDVAEIQDAAPVTSDGDVEW